MVKARASVELTRLERERAEVEKQAAASLQAVQEKITIEHSALRVAQARVPAEQEHARVAQERHQAEQALRDISEQQCAVEQQRLQQAATDHVRATARDDATARMHNEQQMTKISSERE